MQPQNRKSPSTESPSTEFPSTRLPSLPTKSRLPRPKPTARIPGTHDDGAGRKARGSGKRGLGYSYADTATARLIEELLVDCRSRAETRDVPAALGCDGPGDPQSGAARITSMAIAAVVLPAVGCQSRASRFLARPAAGRGAGTRVPIYGSGGFTSYSIEQLREQLGGWAEQGISRVKMKIGTPADDDMEPGAGSAKAIGPTALVVPTRVSRTQALAQPSRWRLGVEWFEEPVSADDLEGLRLMRNRAPAGMDIAAGEYGYDFLLFSADAGRRGCGRAAGRCLALRRDARLFVRRRH